MEEWNIVAETSSTYQLELIGRNQADFCFEIPVACQSAVKFHEEPALTGLTRTSTTSLGQWGITDVRELSVGQHRQIVINHCHEKGVMKNGKPDGVDFGNLIHEVFRSLATSELYVFA
jgi:hypothetical protein